MGYCDDLRAELRQSITNQRELIQSLSAITVMRLRKEPGLLEASLRTQIDIFGGDRLSVSTSKEFGDVSWAEYYARNRVMLIGDEMTIDWPALRVFERRQLTHPVLPSGIEELMFWRGTGWWPMAFSLRAPYWGDVSLNLLDAVSDDRYSLSEEREGPCEGYITLARNAVDRITLSREMGFALVERVLSSNGRADMRIVATAYRSIVPAFWLPSEFDIYLADETGGRDALQDGARTVHITVESVRANSLESSSFQYLPPPGAARFSRYEEDWTQVVAGGLDMLTDVASALCRSYDANRNRQWYVVGVLSVVLAGALGVRSRRLSSARRGGTSFPRLRGSLPSMHPAVTERDGEPA
jgi:hypothetical protein